MLVCCGFSVVCGRLHFMQKPDKDSAPLRDGTVDLETGVIGKATGPEVRVQALFRDRFIGVVRMGHSLSEGEITPSVTRPEAISAFHGEGSKRDRLTKP